MITPFFHKIDRYSWRDYFLPRWIVLDQEGTTLWYTRYYTKAGAMRAWQKWGKK